MKNILFLFLIMILSSCHLLKPLPKSSPKNEQQNDAKEETPNKKTNVKKDKKEEENIEVNDDKDKPRINNHVTHFNSISGLVKIVICLPLDGTYESSRFVETINGFQLASLSDLPNRIKLEIDIINIGQSKSRDELINHPKIKGADIIIGGFQTSQVKILGEISKSSGKPYISIWNSSESLVNDNPNFLQFKPSLRSYCESIINFIETQNSNQKTMVIIKDLNTDDNSIKHYITEEAEKHKDNIQFVDYQAENFEKFFANGQNYQIMIPIYDDFSQILKLLVKLNSFRKNGTQLTVFGMPQWLEYDKWDYVIWANLNLHIPFFDYLPQNDSKIVEFSTQYFKKYNVFATPNAWIGHDLYKLCGSIADKMNQKNAFDPLQLNHVEDLYLNYHFTSNSSNNKSSTHLAPIEYFENKSITIYKFEGGTFEAIR